MSDEDEIHPSIMGWLCACGSFHESGDTCPGCGASRPRPRASCSMADLARLLALVAAPPNLRSRPQTGDRPGDYDQWFDGGTIRFVTGSTEYELDDGTQLSLAVTPQLNLFIRFRDGETLSIHATS